MFSSECAELALPYENYHMETAFENANQGWEMELMVLDLPVMIQMNGQKYIKLMKH